MITPTYHNNTIIQSMRYFVELRHNEINKSIRLLCRGKKDEQFYNKIMLFAIVILTHQLPQNYS